MMFVIKHPFHKTLLAHPFTAPLGETPSIKVAEFGLTGIHAGQRLDAKGGKGMVESKSKEQCFCFRYSLLNEHGYM